MKRVLVFVISFWVGWFYSEIMKSQLNEKAYDLVMYATVAVSIIIVLVIKFKAKKIKEGKIQCKIK